MTNATALANAALGYLGEAKISDILDQGSKAARVAKQFYQDSVDEVLRSHRWNCAIKRMTLSKLAEAPASGYANQFSVPSDFLRLLEVNGEPWESSSEFLSLEGKRILTDENELQLRYIARIDISQFDPLLAKAVALNLALTLAVPLTANLDLQERVATLFRQAIGNARQVDAIECGTRENRPLRRLMDSSPLIQSRFRGSVARLHNRFPRW
jgi:hypothetical protein